MLSHPQPLPASAPASGQKYFKFALLLPHHRVTWGIQHAGYKSARVSYGTRVASIPSLTPPAAFCVTAAARYHAKACQGQGCSRHAPCHPWHGALSSVVTRATRRKGDVVNEEAAWAWLQNRALQRPAPPLPHLPCQPMPQQPAGNPAQGDKADCGMPGSFVGHPVAKDQVGKSA